MNLYATITSERATKGQGGNEYLYIRVKNKEEKVIADLEIQNGHFRFWEDGSMKPWNEPKDPAWLCVECGKRKQDYEAMYCDKCWDTKPELKGKKLMCDWCRIRPATHKDWREIDGTTTSTRECDQCSKLDTEEILKRQTKGEKQKCSAETSEGSCPKDAVKNAPYCSEHMEIVEKTKGKKQKGESTIEDLDREAETRRDIDSMS